MPEYSFQLPRPDRRETGRLGRVLHSLLTIPDRLAQFFCNENVYQEPLDGHGISYFGELIGQYDDLGKERRAHTEADAVIREIRGRAESSERFQKEIDDPKTPSDKIPALRQELKKSLVTWDDLMRFESALLQVMPDEHLRRRTVSIRGEYREVAGEEAWQKYFQNKPPEISGDINQLRQDTAELLSELHWLYISEPVQECQRARLLFTVLCGMFYMIFALGSVFAIIIATVYLFGNHDNTDPMKLLAPKNFPVMIAVMFAGALGGSFSSLLRLQRAQLRGNAVVNLWMLDSMGISAILAPFIGALSAILMLFLITGHLIQGDLFPKISLVNDCEVCAECATNKTALVPIQVTTDGSNSELTSPEQDPSQTPTAAHAAPSTANDSTKLTNTAGDSNSDVAKQLRKPSTTPWPYHFCIPFGVELAKLLIWSFIAGFSERLVPDIIDRLGQKTKG